MNLKKGQFLAPCGDEQRRRQSAFDRQRVAARLRARRLVRLQQPRRRHALARDPARARNARSCSTPRTPCSSPGAQGDVVGRRAASTCPCSRARRWRRASRGCSSRRTPIPTRRCATGRTSWPLASRGAVCSSSSRSIDAVVKARPLSRERVSISSSKIEPLILRERFMSAIKEVSASKSSIRGATPPSRPRSCSRAARAGAPRCRRAPRRARERRTSCATATRSAISAKA